MRWGNKFGLLVCDECHHLPGPSYQMIAIGSIAPFRLGLTATPERSDGPVERKEQARELGRAVGQLTPEQREAFVLKHVEGLPYEEIAELTGATVASLKMRMHRAYDRLRELMKEYR